MWLGQDARGFDHVRVHMQVIKDERLGAHELAVYLGLVVHAEIHSGECWPAAETIAEYAKISISSVRRAVKVLVEAGWIKLQRTRGKPNIYVLLAPKVFHTPVSVTTHPRHRDRTTPVSVTTEQEPLTRTKNKPTGDFNSPRPFCTDCDGWTDGEGPKELWCACL